MDILTRPFADALAATPFVLAQGRNIEKKVYAKRYPTLDYALHVPVVSEGPPWAIGTTFFTVEALGEAKFISGAGNDMPFNSVLLDNGSSDFALIGAGWEWTLEEVNQAAALGIDLYDTDAIAAADKVERLLHSIAMRGAAEKNWTGFVNSPIVPRVDVAANGFGASRLWSAKTVDLMLGDIYALSR